VYVPQPSLNFEPVTSQAADQSRTEKQYSSAFRSLYYHLYTNSRASRAERIIADLSNLLLCKIASERNGGKERIEQFLKGEGSANDLLIPILLSAFPHLTEQDDKFSLEDDALRHGLRELAPLSFHTAPAHILGDAFQALMGPRLRGDKGQFFTPRNLVRAIIEISSPPVSAKVVDPACGTGGFLVETAAYQSEKQQQSDQERKTLIGIDKDRDLCRLAEASLEIAAQGRYTVINTNSLDLAALAKLPNDISPLEADFVFTNPPFGANIKVTDEGILQQFALGHKWTEAKSSWKQETGIRQAQDPQILFIELCIRLLVPGGQLSIVLPEGVFGNSGLGYIWDYVREQGEITALLDCPRTTFQPSTDTKTNVLIFKKGQSPAPKKKRPEPVLMAVALHCGHDRRGRNFKTTGEVYPDDFEPIGKSFNQARKRSSIWQKVEITEPYYLVPRYYDTAPLQELRQEAKKLGAELVTLRELVEKGHLSIRKGHEVGAEAYGTGEIPFVRTSDISNYEVSLDPTRGVSEEIYQEYAPQQNLAPHNILMVADGRYRIGRTAILHEHNYKCVVQSHVRIISVQPTSPISPIELLYLLNLPMVQHQMRNLVFIQSTLGSLGKRLYGISVPLPKPSEEWQATIKKFHGLIEGRAKLLKQLKEFEHQGYEL
jgi:type I restriction enzyme M protein